MKLVSVIIPTYNHSTDHTEEVVKERFGKNAKWYHKIGYLGVMVHLVAVYYCFQAISCKRWDIARAWLKGTWKGIFWKINEKRRSNV